MPNAAGLEGGRFDALTGETGIAGPGTSTSGSGPIGEAW
jgi:hypothetical protein